MRYDPYWVVRRPRVNTLQQLQCVQFVNTVGSVVTESGMTVSDTHVVYTRQVRKKKTEWQ